MSGWVLSVVCQNHQIHESGDESEFFAEQATQTEQMVDFLRKLTKQHKVTEVDLLRFKAGFAQRKLVNPIPENKA